MNLDEIKKKRLAELQQKLATGAQEEGAAQQQLELLKEQVKTQWLTRHARERLNRLKLAHPELAEQVLLAVAQAVAVGQLREKIDDQKLREILATLSKEKKKFKLVK